MQLQYLLRLKDPAFCFQLESHLGCIIESKQYVTSGYKLSRVEKGETESEVPSTVDMLWGKLCIIQTKTEENGEQIGSLPKGLLNLTIKIEELEKRENHDVKDITSSLDDMKSCMATIIGRHTRSEIINNRS